jgi:ABC-type spermidine/putrescine transport system permease subunit II
VRHDRLLAVFYWATVAMLMLPLGLIALTSLTDAALVGFPLGRPSLRWYAATVANPANGRAFLLSLVLAAASAGAAAVAGTWIAVAAAMLRPRWRCLLLAGTLLPLVTPGIVHAIALRIAIRSLGLDPGPLAILLGHTIHATPLAAIMVATRLATTQPGVIDAARDLGAGPVRAFLHVQLPWLRPALAFHPVLFSGRLRDDPAGADLRSPAFRPDARDQRAGDADTPRSGSDRAAFHLARPSGKNERQTAMIAVPVARALVTRWATHRRHAD